MSRVVKRQSSAKTRRKGPAPAAPKVAAGRAASKPGGRVGGLAAMRPRFFTDIVSELRKVTWPTREETLHLTVVVLIVTLMMGALLGGLDATFGWVVDKTLLHQNLFDKFFGTG